MLVKDFLKEIDILAPFSLALDWDNSGLQVGDPESEVKKVALALDPTDRNIQAAVDQKAELLITHHPLIFKPMKNISAGNPLTGPLIKAIKGSLAVISAHTNWDCLGVPLALAETLELTPSGPLEQVPEKLLKLTVFVPADKAEILKQALHLAGAGRLGDYTDCSFEIEGFGQFRPGPDSSPYAGDPGLLAKTGEIRLEMVLPEYLAPCLAGVIKSVHPYEEPAFDFIEIKRPGPGLGLLGEWPSPKEALSFCAQKLDLHPLRWAGPDPGAITKVALLPGSGGGYLTMAQKMGARMLITGEMNYHQALLAADTGFCVLSAGHYETEKPGLLKLGRHLEKITGRLGAAVEYMYLNDQSPWQTRA
ncbi:MAG: Nif3-like dinuclear metal center hexameric protein [Deltaproteobacteria bacterium]|jgi:dinuclear metal center YbgI/SA1388 family protein|nr:Nif3-like dinuclear metal center hexameric protein [Deltaproteobacteria bacterium]